MSITRNRTVQVRAGGFKRQSARQKEESMEKHIDYEKIEKSARLGRNIRKVLVYALLTFWAVIVLFPFYWMILTSVKSYGSYNAEHVPTFYTLAPTMENYLDAFTAVPLARYLGNTVIRRNYNCHYGGGDYPGGLCLCKAQIPGKKPVVHAVSLPDDDSQ